MKFFNRIILRQMVLYALIGLSGMLLDFAVYYLLSSLVGIHYLIANIISVILAITNNYLLNLHFNFRTFNRIYRRYITFLMIGLAGLVISSVMVTLFIEQMAIDKITAKVYSIVFVVIIQFLLNKFITFRE
ncbi:MAG: GtrA family protein [Candidatus Cloacimonetes bacterium]|nr:GtrA family protein [Candidatus Cloacimonadota bacterium]